MNEQKNRDKAIYVIDDEFRIVHFNNELYRIFRSAEQGRRCYEALFQRTEQCSNCPLRKENKGASVFFDDVGSKWIRLSTLSIEWPGVGASTLIAAGALKDDESRYFYDTSGVFDYTELLKLDYLNDICDVVEQTDGKMSVHKKDHGQISKTIRDIAENEIHPDDRARFYTFWLWDQIGGSSVPAGLLSVRHGEFRKKKTDGSYELMQQMFVPVRQTVKNEVFVMSYCQIITPPDELTTEFSSLLNGKIADDLCGKERFFECVEEVLKHSADEVRWCMISIDIENFKVFNAWYGEEKGTELLMDIAASLNSLQTDSSIVAGYFGNDDFALFAPYDEQKTESFYHLVVELIRSHSSNKINVLPAIGVYEVTSKDERIFTMYDRAKIACTSIKGNYAERIKKFDKAMLEKLESEYILFSDVQNALQNSEFTFYLQPKCRLDTGKIIGAEALVRWISPEKGLVPPGVFIPFLEKTGLVSQLDLYIWEEVCKWQRKMLDNGFSVLPVSVNVSKIDLYAMDIPAYFNNLVRKYDLDPRLIEIEITESVYAADDIFIGKVVAQLRESGFRVLMDDFGKAYSALSMLYEVKVDVLKLDIRFLDFDEQTSEKGVRLLESICGMARTLGLYIIVEGIESESQKEILQKMGCRYGQGFYFYGPMPVKEFEKIAAKDENLDLAGLQIENSKRIYPMDLLSRNIFSEIMLDNMLGAVAVYDVCENQITLARYNKHYAALLGHKDFYSERELLFGESLYQEEYQKIFKMFDAAYKNRNTNIPAPCDIHRRRPDGTDIWLRVALYFMRESDGHRLYYGTVSNITEVYRLNEMLKFFFQDMPGGYYCLKGNENGEFLYISKGFLDLLGYTEAEIRRKFDNKFINLVHPDDRQKLRRYMGEDNLKEGNYRYTYRMCAKYGDITVTDQCHLTKHAGDKFFQGVLMRKDDKFM